VSDHGLTNAGNGCLTLLGHVRQVREHTPVVMMSGVTEWGLTKRVVEAGAFAFIQKPFEGAQFAHTVRLAIQCSQMRERVAFGNGAWLDCQKCSDAPSPRPRRHRRWAMLLDEWGKPYAEATILLQD